MNCSYHSQNVAVVNCNGCGKPLCPACDHRIKGFPYCQDCIVTGIELLRSHYQADYVPIVKRQTSPFIATVLSLVCPGLGAAYNGQTVKAIVYFAVFVGLFQMWVLTEGTAIFRWGVIGMWLFAGLDAWRTAQLIRSGVTPNSAEDILVKRFSGNPKLWGIVLTVLGVAFFLQPFLNVRDLMRVGLPLLLIGLGLYLIRGYVFVPRKNDSKWSESSGHLNTPQFTSRYGDADFRGENFNSADDFSTEARARTWKNR